MNQRLKTLFVLLALLAVAGTAQAVLFRVGPNDVPSPPGNGYPLWYQDTNGLALDLCLPRTQAQLNAGVCLILPPDQDPVEGLNLPLVFPTNFPGESFWWNAGAGIDFGNGDRAVLVLALEAAFANEEPVPGDQVTFGRLRIIVDAPVGGTYTVTTPYGVRVFPDVQPGPRAITFTSDIGIGLPGDFSGALNSDIGPVLRAAASPGGTPSPYLNIDNDLFLSDPANPVFVTGSPEGTNFFRICTDGGVFPSGTACVETDLFTLIGKVHTAPIGSPLTVGSATYKRNATSAQVDVYASASPGPGAQPPMLSFGDASGTDLIPSQIMHGPTPNLNQFYGQAIPIDQQTIPAAVKVTNVADIPPSSVDKAVVDEVNILQASFNPANSLLSITAISSDQVTLPQLFVVGLPGSATGSDELTGTVTTATGVRKTGSFTIPPTPAAGPNSGPVPPAAVTVISSKGGHDDEAVVTLAGGSFQAGAPVAVDDNVTVEAGLASIPVAVLLNDSAEAAATTVAIFSQGQQGTAVADTTGLVTYTPTNSTFVGVDTFTYTVRSAAAPNGFQSNVATVTITTTPGAGGTTPIAANDGPFSVQVNQSVQIAVSSLLSNDSGNGGTIDPASFLIGTATGGTATVAGGIVTFTAGAAAGSFGFNYTVLNLGGAVRSNAAIVSVTVLPANDVITNLTARFRTGTRRWDVTGTCAVPGPANAVNLVLVRNGAQIATLATNVAVDAVGAWSFRQNGSSIIAVNGDQVRATSTAGGNASVAVRVTQ